MAGFGIKYSHSEFISIGVDISISAVGDKLQDEIVSTRMTIEKNLHAFISDTHFKFDYIFIRELASNPA